MKDFYLIEGAHLSSKWNFPILDPCHDIPKDIIAFSKTKGVKNFNQYVHFFEIDEKILPFARCPKRYYPRLCQFEGIIGTDFSVYRNMPYSKQIGEMYNNRALSFWLQKRGISVIPNVRYGDERTYEFCFEGLPKNSVISIGTHGCTKSRDYINYHIKGVKETIKQLKPEIILFYGAVKAEIKMILKTEKVEYKIFDSDTSNYFGSKSNSNETYSLFNEFYVGGA